MHHLINETVSGGEEVHRQAFDDEGHILTGSSLRRIVNSTTLFIEVTNVEREHSSMGMGCLGRASPQLHGGRGLHMLLSKYGTPVPLCTASMQSSDANLWLEQESDPPNATSETDIGEDLLLTQSSVPPNTASATELDGNVWLKQPSVPPYGFCEGEFDGDLWLGQSSSSSSGPSQSTSSAQELSGPTTVMINHLHRKYTPRLLEWEINNAGFTSQFDYVYVPDGGRKGQNRGFAFVNFATATIAGRFRHMFDGGTFVLFPSSRPMVIAPAHIQGWANNFQRLLFSPNRMPPLFFRPFANSRQVTEFSTKPQFYPRLGSFDVEESSR